MVLKNCILCDCELSKEKDSKEHIILLAIGGRKKVSGVLCKSYNNKSGNNWDAALAEILAPLCLKLNVKREKGTTPDQVFKTIKGESIRIRSDGTMTIEKVGAEVIEKDGLNYLNVKARTATEARRMLKGMKRKYPDLDIEKVMTQFEYRQTYLDDPLKINFQFGGPKAGRSLVKSALALAINNGVESKSCNTALNYLRHEDALACFGFYYEKDLILNRPAQNIFHCVAISGSAESGLLLAYIEYFSAQRIVVCLSDSYTGPTVHNCYAIDPMTGQELKLDFHIPLTHDDVSALYEYKMIPEGAMAEAMRLPMEIAVKLDFDRAKDRAMNDAINYAFKNCGAAAGEFLTIEQKYKVSRLIAEQLMPFFLRHLRKPVKENPFENMTREGQ